MKKGQSFHHIYETFKNEIPISERSLYIYLKQGLLDIDNLELPRIVRYKKRINTNHYKLKVDKKCYIGRSYADYSQYLKVNPDLPIVQMDSVEGVKGGKVLLTIHFVNCSLMFAFIRERNTAKSVTDVFNDLYKILGKKDFKKLFGILLTDRGTEFSNPTAIEETKGGEYRTTIFFCDAMCCWQKGECEVNHEFFRRVLPKGTPFFKLTEDKVNIIMDNINSYKRAKLGNHSPYEIFEKMYGKEIIKKLGINFIPQEKIILKPSLIK